MEAPEHPLPIGTVVRIGERTAAVERRSGTDLKPLIRVAGVESRDEAAGLWGEPLAIEAAEEPLGEGEWLVEDLVGCRIDGLGEVVGVLEGISCDVLEVGERKRLVPLVSDAVTNVDVDAKLIEVDRGFLGL